MKEIKVSLYALLRIRSVAGRQSGWLNMGGGEKSGELRDSIYLVINISRTRNTTKKSQGGYFNVEVCSVKYNISRVNRVQIKLPLPEKRKSWKMLVFIFFPFTASFLFFLLLLLFIYARSFFPPSFLLRSSSSSSRVRRRRGERRSNTLGTEWDAGSQICAAGRFPTPWQPPTARPS